MDEPKGMVDVSGKQVTVRTARACGTVRLGAAAFEAVAQGTCPKGDVLATAKIAAVQAVKATPTLIPLCHPILVEGIEVAFALDEARAAVGVTVSVKSSGKTGVEMEALTAVSVAALTIYDMAKAVEKTMRVENVRLVRKQGGKSGDVVLEDEA